MQLHLNLLNDVTLWNVTPSLISQNPRERIIVLSLNLPPCYHIFLPFITFLGIKIIPFTDSNHTLARITLPLL